MVRSGRGVPVYAYAYNNPLQYSDPTGLVGLSDGPTSAEIIAFVNSFRTAADGARTAHYDRNQYNVVPSFGAVSDKANGWVQMPYNLARYHRFRGQTQNVKFVSSDGACEAVYSHNSLVTDAKCKLTP